MNDTTARISIPHITKARAERIFRLCRRPAAAGRACERIDALARRHSKLACALYALSDALGEHRHFVLCTIVGDADGMAEHARNRDECVTRACGLGRSNHA